MPFDGERILARRVAIRCAYGSFKTALEAAGTTDPSTEIELYAGNAVAARNSIMAHWPGFRSSLLDRIAQPILIESRSLRARTAIALAALDEQPAGFPGRDELLREAAHDAKTIRRERMLWGGVLRPHHLRGR